MAKQAFKQRLNTLLRDAQDELSGSKGSKGFLVQDGTILTVTIRGREFRSAFKSATRKILKGMGLSKFNRQVNTDDMWNEALKDSGPDIKNLVFEYWGHVEPKGKSRYQLDLLGGVAFRPGAYENQITGSVISLDFVASDIDGSLQEVYVVAAIKFIKDTIWNNWVELARKKLSNKRFLGHADEKGRRFSRSTKNPDGLVAGTYSALLTSGGVKAAHKESSTSGVKALEALRDNNAQITLENATLDVYDFAEDFLSGLKITARDKRFKKKLEGQNLPGRSHLIEVRIARNTKEKSDIDKIKKAGEDYIANWVKEQIKQGNIVNMDEESSKSFKQDLIDSAVLGVTGNLKSRGTQTKVKKKIRATKTHEHNYSVSVGKGRGKPSKQKRKKMSLAGATLVAAASRQPRLQSGKKVAQKSLAQIKGYINRGLHNEIQRNMGRPALNYQTGQFARSAALTSLYRANKTIVGEYTYQLDPYQTFENTGEKQWPLGYNPKPLIARSIRQLATRHTQTKFTLRRI